MTMNQEQLNKLINMITTVGPDELDCDGCFKHIAEFAEAHLLGKTLEESQIAVKTHLENCICCRHEFENLLSALDNINE